MKSRTPIQCQNCGQPIPTVISTCGNCGVCSDPWYEGRFVLNRRYEVIDRVGTGGQGSVYRARHTQLKNRYGSPLYRALKRLPWDWSVDPERRARFQREAQLASNLDSKYCVHVVDLDTEEGGLVLVTEFADLGALEHHIPAGGMEVAIALAVARHVCLGLKAIHDNHSIHRDIKPSNILLFSEPEATKEFPRISFRAKIGDLGIAASLNEDYTRTGNYFSSEGFSAPEQTGTKAADQSVAVDVFGLGMTLYHMLAGRGPYLPEQYRGMWPQVLVENPPKPPSTFRPNLKSVRGLDEFVLRLIAFKPEDRVQSIDQALQGVEGFLRELAAADIAAQVAAPSMPGPVGTRPANLDRTVLLLLVGSLITLAAGGAWIASKAAQMERRGSEVAIPSIPHRPLTPVPAPRVPEPTPTQEPFRQNTQEIAGSPERAYPKEKGGNGGRALRPRLLKHPRRRIEGSLLQASEIDFVRQTREHLHNGEISAAAVTVRMGLRTYPDSDALKQLSRQQRQQRAGR